VRLTLAWGMDPPGDENPHPPGSGWTWWLPAGTTISSELVDVFYCGSLIDRHVGARVEYAILPYPKTHGFTEIGDPNVRVGWTVTKWQVDFFGLIHSIRYPTESYESWVDRAQFVVDDS